MSRKFGVGISSSLPYKCIEAGKPLEKHILNCKMASVFEKFEVSGFHPLEQPHTSFQSLDEQPTDYYVLSWQNPVIKALLLPILIILVVDFFNRLVIPISDAFHILQKGHLSGRTKYDHLMENGKTNAAWLSSLQARALRYCYQSDTSCFGEAFESFSREEQDNVFKGVLASTRFPGYVSSSKAGYSAIYN